MLELVLLYLCLLDLTNIMSSTIDSINIALEKQPPGNFTSKDHPSSKSAIYKLKKTIKKQKKDKYKKNIKTKRKTKKKIKMIKTYKKIYKNIKTKKNKTEKKSKKSRKQQKKDKIKEKRIYLIVIVCLLSLNLREILQNKNTRKPNPNETNTIWEYDNTIITMNSNAELIDSRWLGKGQTSLHCLLDGYTNDKDGKKMEI